MVRAPILPPEPVDALGEGIVLWTVRLALVCYFASVELRLIARSQVLSRNTPAKQLWAIGYLAFLLHFFAAFHLVHNWSHQHAFDVTARRTLDTVGVSFGEGIYVNHLFLLVWGLDAGWWLSSPVTYLQRPRWLNLTIHLFMAFIAFHATVTFGQGWVRYWGIAATGLLFTTICMRRIRGRPELAGTPARSL